MLEVIKNIEFIRENAEAIVSYEVEETMDVVLVEFTMVNGEKIEKVF